MRRIITLTMNPALDLSTSVEELKPEKKLRCGPGLLDPGGGGVNVARVVHRLGGQVTPIFTVGGAIGDAYRSLLEAEGIGGQPISIEGDTRLNLTVRERRANEQYRFVLKGPELSESEWRRCLDAVYERLEEGSFIVASGSLPPGVPQDFYARLASCAKQRQALCVVDTSGEPLRAALEEGVFFVKPNHHELRELTGRGLDTPDEQDAAVRELVERGGSEIAALTLGAKGAVLASSKGVVRMPAPEVEARSAVGAGDSFVGAFVLALARGAELEDALRYASAAGAAALLTRGTELCRREDVERLDREIAASCGAAGQPVVSSERGTSR